jgi:hypothetical protein
MLGQRNAPTGSCSPRVKGVGAVFVIYDLTSTAVCWIDWLHRVVGLAKAALGSWRVIV